MKIKDLLAMRKEYSKEECKLEKWYDRQTRSWVIQLKDPDGNQVGEAIYVASRKEANQISKDDFYN